MSTVARRPDVWPGSHVSTGGTHSRPFATVLQYVPKMSDSTPSALEDRRWQAPVQQLLAAAAEATQLMAERPTEQIEPRPEAMKEALNLLTWLPTGLLPPAPVVEPRGTVAWEWEGDGAHLILALNGTGMLQHSAIIDGQKHLGEDRFTWRLPREVLSLLERFDFRNA
jgi:hypothetical protein